MSNLTYYTTCDDCEKPMVVLNKSVGANCQIGICTVCANAPITTHDQGAIDDRLGTPVTSMVVGVRIAQIEL